MAANAGDIAQEVKTAAGRYTIAAGVLTVVKQTGSVTVARTGAGVVTLTTPVPGALGSVAAAERRVVFSQEQFGSAPTVAYTSDTVTTVNTFAVDGVTATDKNGSFEIWQIQPSQ
jgi:hypothetical protein